MLQLEKKKKKKKVLKIPSSNGHNQGSKRSGSDGNIKVCTRAVIEYTVDVDLFNEQFLY